MEFDFAANAVVDSTDSFPDDVKPLYTKGADGKFVISDTVKPLVNAFMTNGQKLKKALTDKTSANNESAQRRLLNSAITGILPDLGIEITDDMNDLTKAAELLPKALKDKFGELMNSSKAGKELGISIENVRKDAAAKIAAANKEKEDGVSAATNRLYSYIRTNEINAALTKHTLVENGADMLMPMIIGQTKVVVEDGKEHVRVVDGDGNPVMSQTGGWMDVNGLITGLKTKYPMLFVSDKKPGMGSPSNQQQQQQRQQMFNMNNGEKSSDDKIAAGLAKRRAGQ